MGRFSDGGGDDAGEPGIDMSSMLDCVFILLIFFIVTTTFVDERGLEVERPTPSAGGDSPKPTVALVVDKAGNVFYEGRKVAVSAVGAIVQRALRLSVPSWSSCSRRATPRRRFAFVTRRRASRKRRQAISSSRWHVEPLRRCVAGQRLAASRRGTA